MGLANPHAMEIPEAAGQRFLAAVDRYSNHQIAKIIKENFSDLASRLHEQVAVPNTGSRFMVDTSPMKILGISSKPLKDSVIDTVSSVLERGWPAQQRLCLTVLRKLSSPKAHALVFKMICMESMLGSIRKLASLLTCQVLRYMLGLLSQLDQ